VWSSLCDRLVFKFLKLVKACRSLHAVATITSRVALQCSFRAISRLLGLKSTTVPLLTGLTKNETVEC